MKLVCKMISTVDYHVFGYEITMYYYAIHWEHWGRYERGLAMKLAKTDNGQPPLFMAYWLWAPVYLLLIHVIWFPSPSYKILKWIYLHIALLLVAR